MSDPVQPQPYTDEELAEDLAYAKEAVSNVPAGDLPLWKSYLGAMFTSKRAGFYAMALVDIPRLSRMLERATQTITEDRRKLAIATEALLRIVASEGDAHAAALKHVEYESALTAREALAKIASPLPPS